MGHYFSTNIEISLVINRNTIYRKYVKSIKYDYIYNIIKHKEIEGVKLDMSFLEDRHICHTICLLIMSGNPTKILKNAMVRPYSDINYILPIEFRDKHGNIIIISKACSCYLCMTIISKIYSYVPYMGDKLCNFCETCVNRIINFSEFQIDHLVSMAYYKILLLRYINLIDMDSISIILKFMLSISK